MKRIAWALLAAFCFGMTVICGAIAANAFFFDRFPTFREFLEHVAVISAAAAVAFVLIFMGLRCLARAVR